MPRLRPLPLAVALTFALPGVAMAQSDTASVSVVHGIPNTPVDVYANDERLLDDFAPQTIAGPLTLPADDYTIEIRAADADADAEPLIAREATVEADTDVSLVAHLDAEGEPTLTPFANNREPVPAGRARVSVRHTAAAPAVDVLAGGEPLVEGLENPEARSVEAPAGTIEVTLTPAGEDEVVTGPISLDLAAGGAYAVYAIGSVEDDTDTLLVQQLNAAAGAPGAVPAGDSGLLDAGAPAGPLAALGLVGAAGLSASLLMLRRTRQAVR